MSSISYLPHVSPANNNNRQVRRRVTDVINTLNNTVGSTANATGQLGELNTEVEAIQKQIADGGITFPAVGGKGSIAGAMVAATSPSGANTEFAVAHNLGRIPHGYLVFWTSVAASVYQGPSTGTAWTAANIYIKANQSSVAMSLFIT